MSKKETKSLKAPKNESREDGSSDSLLVLSDRERALYDVIQANGFSLSQCLRVVAFYSEELERGPKLVLGSLKPPVTTGKTKTKQALAPVQSSLPGSPEEPEESKDELGAAPSRSQVVPGSGSTRRTRVKEARKELLTILAVEIELVPREDLRGGLERLAWLQSSVDWDVMSQNSPKLRDLSGPKVDLIREVLSQIDLRALQESKAKAVKASVLESRRA